MLLFRDLIRLFACYNDGIINLLEKYFDMNKKQCRDALDLYKRFLVRMDKVGEFLKVAEVCHFAAIVLSNCESLPLFPRFLSFSTYALWFDTLNLVLVNTLSFFFFHDLPRSLQNVGIDKGDIPDLTKAPSSLLDALEGHLATLEGRKTSAANTPTQSSRYYLFTWCPFPSSYSKTLLFSHLLALHSVHQAAMTMEMALMNH